MTLYPYINITATSRKVLQGNKHGPTGKLQVGRQGGGGESRGKGKEIKRYPFVYIHNRNELDTIHTSVLHHLYNRAESNNNKRYRQLVRSTRLIIRAHRVKAHSATQHHALSKIPNTLSLNCTLALSLSALRQKCMIVWPRRNDIVLA